MYHVKIIIFWTSRVGHKFEIYKLHYKVYNLKNSFANPLRIRIYKYLKNLFNFLSVTVYHTKQGKGKYYKTGN